MPAPIFEFAQEFGVGSWHRLVMLEASASTRQFARTPGEDHWSTQHFGDGGNQTIRRRNAMRLANRALFVALALLVCCAAVSAQTLRPESDPRNQSPSVGTGGPVGGPTGLFTIYDGSTIRKGEFTFSIAYSNYDRDPGNVDITDIPASFNVGLNDHIEVFFKSNFYRGIKVNNPAQLSGFYMPNVSLCSALSPCIGPAIILAPSGPNVGTLAGNAIFRPLNNQPFVGFPYIGSSAGN